MIACMTCDVPKFVSTKGDALSASDTLPICRRMSERVAEASSKRLLSRAEASRGSWEGSQKRARLCVFATLELIRLGYETDTSSPAS